MRAEPIRYSIEEGGEWHEWKKWPESPKPHIHAVQFSDYSIFDTVNGWRKKPVVRVKAVTKRA
jgi:hypothetical protein